MMTVHEVSKISGVSIRALHHYDKIGLLPATEVTKAGYRLYDDKALERLQHILLFKELEFSLKEIKDILDSPGFDRSKALEQQIQLLELRKEHLQNLNDLAWGIKTIGVKNMSFEAFDTKKIDEYAAKAKASWGQTDAYKEYEQKSEGRTKEVQQKLNIEMMDIFAQFGKIKDQKPDSEEAIRLSKKLQDHITENYYTCTNEILQSLGEMYAGGGGMSHEESGGNMEVRVIRSNRKTVAIQVNSDLTVTVRAPKYVSEKYIEQILREKESWIRKHIDEIKAKKAQHEAGNVKPLTRDELQKLADEAVEYIPKRVEHFAKIIGVDYGRITIRNQKTRWGSCSSKGNLNFNCLLMLTPPEVIDYVVVHELCHRKEMNHSKAFWSEVEKVIPNYKEYVEWLKNSFLWHVSG